MAQLTWPMQVMRSRPTETEAATYIVMQVVGMGMENELVTLVGDERERDSVQISVALRNMYFSGQRDALESGALNGMLTYALSAVERVNLEHL